MKKSMKKQNKKDATFAIKGVQKDFNGDENVIEFMTEGEVIFCDDCVLLEYREGELSGMAGQNTSLELRENSVSMVRSGEGGVTMHFEKGKQYQSYYNTPFGSISISVFGNGVFHNIGEKGGQVRLDYIIDMDGAHSYENKFYLDVKVK